MSEDICPSLRRFSWAKNLKADFGLRKEQGEGIALQAEGTCAVVRESRNLRSKGKWTSVARRGLGSLVGEAGAERRPHRVLKALLRSFTFILRGVERHWSVFSRKTTWCNGKSVQCDGWEIKSGARLPGLGMLTLLLASILLVISLCFSFLLG